MAEEQATEKSNAYWIHKLLAVVLDVVVVVAFVLIGGRSHQSEFEFGDVLMIGLPFIASFFAVLIVVSSDLRSVRSAFIASIISVPIAILMRVNLPQLVGREEYSFKPVFAIISLVFLTLFWCGWRWLLGILRPAK